MEPLEREARRLFRRYCLEIVEALNICPWAEKARVAGQVAEAVQLDPGLDPIRDGQVVRAWGEDPAIEIGFLIYPRCRDGREAFEAYVRRVRDAYDQDPGEAGVLMAVVAFHPDAKPDTSTGLSLVNFVRRTPDPTIQCIRLSTLEHLRRSESRGTVFMSARDVDLEAMAKDQPPAAPLHQRIADANRETVLARGPQAVEAMLDDIRADRDRTYRALEDAQKHAS